MVVAHIWTNPSRNNVVGIGVDHSFPGLEGSISLLESGICCVGVVVLVGNGVAVMADSGVAVMGGGRLAMFRRQIGE